MATSVLPPQHKAGDSFTRLLPIPSEFPDGTPLPDGYFVGWVPTSQIRNEAGVLVADVNCTWLDPVTTRNLKLRVDNTRGWKPERVLIDVQFTRTADNEVMSTTTASFTVTKDITQPS